MSDSILERSLDDIIGDKKKQPRKQSGKRVTSNSKYPSKYNTRAPPRNQQSISFRRDSSLPRDVLDLSRGRPVLRVKNIHPDLNGVDLSNLFGTVSPVDFVKFDNKNDTIAYVCFHNDNQRSNGESVNKFDGKKAMGNRLTVEVAGAASLVDRISLNDRLGKKPFRSERPERFGSERFGSERSKPFKPRQPKAKPVKKTPKDLDTLDEELNAYMNQGDGSNNNDDMNLD